MTTKRTYCTRHDIFDCPFAHDPADEPQPVSLKCQKKECA